jgi:hypothetical protein
MDEQIDPQCREIGSRASQARSQSQEEAVAIALKFTAWPALATFLITFFICLFCGSLRVLESGLFLSGMVFGSMTLLISFPAGTLIGWIAHRTFRSSTIPVARMAIVLAITFDFVIFGWALALGFDNRFW